MTKQQYGLFRSLTSLIFIYAGIKHLIHPQGIFKRVSASYVYELLQNEWLFRMCILLSGAVMIIAGIALLLGYKTKIAAWLLLAILVPITLSTQLENLNDLGPFFKNVAIAGSLLFIINRKKYETDFNLSDSGPGAFKPVVVRTENINPEKR